MASGTMAPPGAHCIRGAFFIAPPGLRLPGTGPAFIRRRSGLHRRRPARLRCPSLARLRSFGLPPPSGNGILLKTGRQPMAGPAETQPLRMEGDFWPLRFFEGGRQMKYDYNVFGIDMDDLSEAARQVGRRLEELGKEAGDYCQRQYGNIEQEWTKRMKETPGFAPVYAFPPVNQMILNDRSMRIEFALPGYEGSNVKISFQGDYLVLSARASQDETADTAQVLHHHFHTRDIDRQKYFVPKSEYAQEKAQAVFKNSVLTVTVPPIEDMNEATCVKIEVVHDDEQ